MQVEHDYAHSLAVAGQPCADDPHREPLVLHPLVREHPDSGLKSLYMGMFCTHVVELGREQGSAFLDALLEQVTQPEFVYRHSWQSGDLIIWITAVSSIAPREATR